MPAGASSPCLLCAPSPWIPSPYLGRAGAKGDAGPHKAPGCRFIGGIQRCPGDPTAPLPHGWAHTGEQGWLFFPTAGPGCYQGPAEASSALWWLCVGGEREIRMGQPPLP